MSRSNVPTLAGDRVTLRAPTATDQDAYQQLGRTPEIVNAFGGDTPATLTISDLEAEDWYVMAVTTPNLWVIEVTGRFAGTARLHSLDAHDRRASYTVGILAPGLLGRGIGTEVTTLVLNYAFADLELHRVGVRVLATNARAVRGYEKCGFVVEGQERESSTARGSTTPMMGVVRLDWEARCLLG